MLSLNCLIHSLSFQYAFGMGEKKKGMGLVGNVPNSGWIHDVQVKAI